MAQPSGKDFIEMKAQIFAMQAVLHALAETHQNRALLRDSIEQFADAARGMLLSFSWTDAQLARFDAAVAGLSQRLPQPPHR